MGAGAVGCFYGGMLARAGVPVTLIGRARHVEAIKRDGLRFESAKSTHSLQVQASTEPEAVREAGLVLLCVKTIDTEAAARSLVPHLSDGSIVLSLQNGVDNIERIRASADLDALAAAVYVGAEMVGPGHVKHTARGDLVIGDTPRPQVDRIARLFVDASVPCRISDNLQGELWAKLIMNCAYNAMSAMGRVPYGRITGNPYTHDIIRLAVEEVLAVAKVAGVRMPEGDRVALAWKLAESMPEVVSSTAQDVSRHKPTEIDALNGYVARRGAELGVATPVNQTLHALVKLLEEPA